VVPPGGQAADAARPQRLLAAERWALALLALGGPAFLPGALNRFVFPKLVVVGVGVLLAATVPARGRLPGAAVALLALGALLLLVDALAGRSPAAQLIGRPPRYEGVLVLPVYVGAGLAGARLLGAGRARGSTAWFLRVLAVASIAVAIEAVLEAAGLRPLSSDISRPGGLLGNASDEGAWALLVLGPLGAVALRTRGWLLGAGALAAAVTLVCSGSRGALLGAIVVGAVVASLTPGRRRRTLVLAGLVAIVVGAFALPATRARVVGSNAAAAASVTGRLLLWGETLHLLVDHPLLGVGPSGYLDTIPAYHSRHYERKVGPRSPPDSPHDWLLQAAVAGGLPLLLLALGLAALTAQGALRAAERQPTGGERAAIVGMLAALAGYGTALLFDFTSPGTTPLAAVLGGALLAGAALPEGPARRVPAARAVAIGLAGVLIVVLAAAGMAESPLRAGITDAVAGRFAAADHQFDVARDLRPWDGAVPATAAHAYAVLAAAGARGAASRGLPWARRGLRDYPDSIQALEDEATLDLAAGRSPAAVVLLTRAHRLEPANPAIAQLEALARRRGA
jgi:hypothetical protein